MIEIVSLEYGEEEGFGAGWNCRFKVDGFDCTRVLFLDEAKTEEDARAWLNSHYEELLEGAIEIYGAAIDSIGLLRQIRRIYAEVDLLKVDVEKLKTT